jgi:hypothetical protein
MTVDTTVLLSLVMLSTAALAVGIAGWVLLLRDRRALKGARDAEDVHAEGS